MTTQDRDLDVLMSIPEGTPYIPQDYREAWRARLLALDQRKRYPRPSTWLRGLPAGSLLYITTPHNRPGILRIHLVK